MARYIDADELYKATQKRIAEANKARMAVVDDEFLDLINDAFTEDVAPRAEWISVEERLPESLQRVLAINTEGDMFTAVYISFVTGKNAWSTSYSCLGVVTHWMPLPEPPKTNQ